MFKKCLIDRIGVIESDYSLTNSAEFYENDKPLSIVKLDKATNTKNSGCYNCVHQEFFYERKKYESDSEEDLDKKGQVRRDKFLKFTKCYLHVQGMKFQAISSGISDESIEAINFKPCISRGTNTDYYDECFSIKHKDYFNPQCESELEEYEEKTRLRHEKLATFAKRIDAACQEANEINANSNDTEESRRGDDDNQASDDTNQQDDSGNEAPSILQKIIHMKKSGSPPPQATQTTDCSHGFSHEEVENSFEVTYDDLKKSSFEELVSQVDFTKDNLKRRLGDWLRGNGTISKLRSYFRGLVVTALNQMPVIPPSDRYSELHECICLLIADFLLQNKLDFSICVFCTEIVTVLGTYERLKNFGEKLVNNGGCKNIKDLLLDCSDVFFILKTFNIHCSGFLAKDILQRYYNLDEGPLLQVLLMILLFDSVAMKQSYQIIENDQAFGFSPQSKVEFKNMVSLTYKKIEELKIMQAQVAKLYKSQLSQVQKREAKKFSTMLQAYKIRQNRLISILSEVENCMTMQKKTFQSACSAEEEILLQYANKLTDYYNELSEHIRVVEDKEKELYLKELDIITVQETGLPTPQTAVTTPRHKIRKTKSQTSLRKYLTYSRRRRLHRKSEKLFNKRSLSDKNFYKLPAPGIDKSEQSESNPSPESGMPNTHEMTFVGGDIHEGHSSCYNLHDENVQLRSVIYEQQKRIDSLTKRNQELIGAVMNLRLNSTSAVSEPAAQWNLSPDNAPRRKDNRLKKSALLLQKCCHRELLAPEFNNLAVFELAINDAKNKCFSLKLETEMIDKLIGFQGKRITDDRLLKIPLNRINAPEQEYFEPQDTDNSSEYN